eukprot:14845458-Ditylum_brightwellii.AAC.1
MFTVWIKIAHTHRNNHHSSITSLRIPESWPQIEDDIIMVTDLDNPKKAKTTFWPNKRYTIHNPPTEYRSGLGCKFHHV